MPLIFLGFIMLAFSFSAVRAGLSPAVLWGKNGRDAGLYFLLCCLLGCFCIGTGKCHETFLQGVIALSGAFIALTGFLNLLGLDPLRMYDGFPREQRISFLSTIGNANFYGCTLLFSLSSAVALWVSGRYPFYGFCCSLVIAMGICCSVSDMAILGMLCSGPILLYMVWGDGKAMRRSLFFSFMCVLLIPAVHTAMISWSRLYLLFPGLTGFMIKKFVFIPLALILFCAWILTVVLHKKGKIPGRPGLWSLFLIFLIAGALILFAGIRFGKLNYNGVDLKENQKAEFSLMEFAGKRGFIYDACLRCYHDFSLDKKLFGCGVDNLRLTIEPYLYIDGVRLFKTGDYLNDAHCQPLHYLLTCGFLGFAAYTGFYVCIVLVLWKRREKNSFSDGILLSLLLYFPSFLFNVAQPIMLILFFGSAGAGMSCILRKERK